MITKDSIGVGSNGNINLNKTVVESAEEPMDTRKYSI
jgi:hypothetical protein